MCGKKSVNSRKKASGQTVIRRYGYGTMVLDRKGGVEAAGNYCEKTGKDKGISVINFRENFSKKVERKMDGLNQSRKTAKTKGFYKEKIRARIKM